MRPTIPVLCSVALLASLAAAPARTAEPSATLESCGSALSPKVVFPASMPGARSGPGAILWLGGAPGCSSSRSSIDVATLGEDDRPGAAARFVSFAALSAPLSGPLTVAGTTAGQAVAAAGAPAALYAEGPASARSGSVHRLAGPPTLVATATGFIGDVDIANVAPGPRGAPVIELREQRHYERAFGEPRTLASAGSAAVSALALGMDFRGDTIVVWAQGGSVYARGVSNTGVVGALARLGESGSAPQLAAVLSDDTRAIVLWTDQPPRGASASTRVLFDQSATQLRFSSPLVLDAYVQPRSLRLGAGADAVVRLSTEGVLIAWTSYAQGSYLVRAAGVTQHGAETPVAASQAGADERLAAIAAGPHGDAALALVRAPRTEAGFAPDGEAIVATSSYHPRGGGVAFTAPLSLAAAGENGAPSVAVDPATDAAVYTWRTVRAGAASVAYAVRGPE